MLRTSHRDTNMLRVPWGAEAERQRHTNTKPQTGRKTERSPGGGGGHGRETVLIEEKNSSQQALWSSVKRIHTPSHWRREVVFPVGTSPVRGREEFPLKHQIYKESGFLCLAVKLFPTSCVHCCMSTDFCFTIQWQVCSLIHTRWFIECLKKELDIQSAHQSSSESWPMHHQERNFKINLWTKNIIDTTLLNVCNNIFLVVTFYLIIL